MSSTIKDVAKKSGLSLGTVSRYLNGYQIKEKNRILIEQAIEELDFKVNLFARGLRTNESKIIGFIIPSMSLTFTSRMIETIERYLSFHGYGMIICTVLEETHIDKEKLNILLHQRLDGLIILPSAQNKILQEWILEGRFNFPVIILDRILPSLKEYPHITVDNANATYHATLELIKKGHKRIAFIAGDKYGYTSDEREKGFIQALTDNKLPVNQEYIYYGDFLRESGYEGGERLLNLSEKPTAIIVSSYDMTLGFVEYCNLHQVKIGSDISVIGFDLSEISDIVVPSLSMIVQPIEEMGLYAAKSMIDKIVENKVIESKEFPCNLLIKDSIQEIKEK